MYQGAVVMNGLEQWQDTISQNIASASVPGYKKTEVSFEVIDPSMSTETEGVSPSIESRAIAPNVVGRIDFRPGGLLRTEVPTDVAIEGEGFFELEAPDGQTIYSRNGQFHVDSDNTLVNNMGFQVIGESGAITFNPAGGPITITKSGAISQGGAVVGKLGVTGFENSENLLKVHGGFMQNPDQPAEIKDVENPKFNQGYIEASNVSAINEMVNLITVSRAYELNQRVIRGYDEHLARAIQVLGNSR